ncbi:hypothetical protein BGX27_005201, partial [Mortierella sp. AM989]
MCDVEAAEDISYHIPGLRETSGWFPEEIYYTVKPRDINKYRKVTKKVLDVASTLKSVDLTKIASKAKNKLDMETKSITKDILEEHLMSPTTYVEESLQRKPMQQPQPYNMQSESVMEQSKSPKAGNVNVTDQAMSLETHMGDLSPEQNTEVMDHAKSLETHTGVSLQTQSAVATERPKLPEMHVEISVQEQNAKVTDPTLSPEMDAGILPQGQDAEVAERVPSAEARVEVLLQEQKEATRQAALLRAHMGDLPQDQNTEMTEQ